MNKIGGKSNSGEGGENPKRYEIQDRTITHCTRIKPFNNAFY
jgi:glutamate synthase domain-containing protein 2